MASTAAMVWGGLKSAGKAAAAYGSEALASDAAAKIGTGVATSVAAQGIMGALKPQAPSSQMVQGQKGQSKKQDLSSALSGGGEDGLAAPTGLSGSSDVPQPQKNKEYF